MSDISNNTPHSNTTVSLPTQRFCALPFNETTLQSKRLPATVSLPLGFLLIGSTLASGVEGGLSLAIVQWALIVAFLRFYLGRTPRSNTAKAMQQEAPEQTPAEIKGRIERAHGDWHVCSIEQLEGRQVWIRVASIEGVDLARGAVVRIRLEDNDGSSSVVIVPVKIQHRTEHGGDIMYTGTLTGLDSQPLPPSIARALNARKSFRVQPRFNESVLATVHSPMGAWSGKMVDVSTNGIGVLCSGAHLELSQCGTMGHLEVQFPDSRPVRIPSQIQRLSPNGARCVVGMVFVNDGSDAYREGKTAVLKYVMDRQREIMAERYRSQSIVEFRPPHNASVR